MTLRDCLRGARRIADDPSHLFGTFVSASQAVMRAMPSPLGGCRARWTRLPLARPRSQEDPNAHESVVPSLDRAAGGLVTRRRAALCANESGLRRGRGGEIYRFPPGECVGARVQRNLSLV